MFQRHHEVFPANLIKMSRKPLVATKGAMSTPYTTRPTSPLSPQLITSVYLPSAIVLFGVGFAKKEWLPFALVIPIVLGALHYYGNGQFVIETQRREICLLWLQSVVKKALKPDVFQDFALKEKTVLSHNVAMCAPKDFDFDFTNHH